MAAFPQAKFTLRRLGRYFVFYRLSFRFTKTEVIGTVDVIASNVARSGPDGDGGLPVEDAA